MEVRIQICENCRQHAWCTRHEEGRYEHAFMELKRRIEADIPGARVLRHREERGGYPVAPVIGSFEIEAFDVVFFSKLRRRVWPSPAVIVATLEAMAED
jgi:hypothetical protein